LQPKPHNHFNSLAQQASNRLTLSLVITLAFVFIEAAAGFWSNSLALLSDAAHNLTDVIALGLSWYALRLSLQPANARHTFGYHRAGILAALVNSTALVLIALSIFYEAIQRLVSSTTVDAPVLAGVGFIAFLVNAGTAWLVKHGSQHDLNLRSAFVHLMGDVFSTLGAAVAGLVIIFTGWHWLDPVVSFLIGLLILWNAWGILRETIDILLESTPQDLNVAQLIADLEGLEGIMRVHDLHVWSINQSLRSLSAHIVTDDMLLSSGSVIQDRINQVLREKYGISHATLQMECASCGSSLYCDLTESWSAEPQNSARTS